MSKLLGEKIPTTCCLPNYMQCMCINLNLSFCFNYSCNTSATLSIGSLRYVHLRKTQFLSKYKFCLYTYLIELINIISMEIQTSSSSCSKVLSSSRVDSTLHPFEVDQMNIRK